MSDRIMKQKKGNKNEGPAAFYKRSCNGRRQLRRPKSTGLGDDVKKQKILEGNC
jgi:hypothetical protein